MRQVYKAEAGGEPLRVYHLRYDESAETDQFSAGLARERRSLESLIADKAHMVLPAKQDPSQVRGCSLHLYGWSDSCCVRRWKPCGHARRGSTSCAHQPSHGPALCPLSSSKWAAVMPAPTTRPQKLLGTEAPTAALPAGMGGVEANNAMTRRGGGTRAGGRLPPRRCIVDVREFMSHLPAVLHQQGLEIVPVTLEVGVKGFEGFCGWCATAAPGRHDRA